MLVRRALVPTGALLVALASGPLATAAVAEKPCDKEPRAVVTKDCEDKDDEGGNGNGNGGAAAEGRPTGSPEPEKSPKAAKSPKPEKSERAKQGSSGRAERSPGSNGNRTAGGDPRGNNGTIKIDGEPFDTSHGNEPHVGCTFRVLFWGFDRGQTADITFAGQAPTGGGTLLVQRGVAISDDAAGGGQDLDATLTYTAQQLGLLGITPHPQQGWHVKVSVDVLEAPGGAKQKVFWIDCPTTATTAASAGSAGAASTDSDVAAPRRTADRFTGGGGSLVLGPPAGAAAPSTTRTQAEPRAAATGGGGALAGFAASLPFTGAPLVGLVALGLGALGAGAMAIRSARARS